MVADVVFWDESPAVDLGNTVDRVAKLFHPQHFVWVATTLQRITQSDPLGSSGFGDHLALTGSHYIVRLRFRIADATSLFASRTLECHRLWWIQCYSPAFAT